MFANRKRIECSPQPSLLELYFFCCCTNIQENKLIFFQAQVCSTLESSTHPSFIFTFNSFKPFFSLLLSSSTPPSPPTFLPSSSDNTQILAVNTANKGTIYTREH
uniref:Uncharacterized protein n=1 Tax=Cacopsylla melanoneura TaxID=428564 RepID=A0A8D9BQL5_9HEMI